MTAVRLVDAAGSPSVTVDVELSASDRLVESGGRIRGFSDATDFEPLYVARSGKTAWVWHRGRTFELRLEEPTRRRRPGTSDDSQFRAPMPGRIARLCVAENLNVAQGTTLLILEAMKMEHEIKAPADGRVVRFHHREGAQVDAGSELLDFESEVRNV